MVYPFPESTLTSTPHPNLSVPVWYSFTKNWYLVRQAKKQGDIIKDRSSEIVHKTAEFITETTNNALETSGELVAKTTELVTETTNKTIESTKFN